MTVPVFEEYEPAPDCDCPGCVGQRRTLAAGGHPAAHGCRRALVLFTAAGVVLTAPDIASATQTVKPPDPASTRRAAAEPGHEQGGRGPLYGGPLSGPSGVPAVALPETTRTDIINRAKKWVTAKVPYSMAAYWSDGYRQDCSGYVSMAWNLASNEWTGSLAQFATKITREELQPGDILLFHNPANPTNGSHVTIFGGWTDATHTSYTAYEQTKPHAIKQATPMAYWSNSDKYVPYRYRGVVDSATGALADAYPGAGSFGPGADNPHVTRLGEMLVARGGKRFYQEGPGPRWGEADRKATEAFQLAQGWTGSKATGLPGPDAWELLVTGKGKDIPAAQAEAPAPTAGPGGTGAAVPPYPGARYFRPGQSNEHITKLGRRLVARGYGKHYKTGPGPRWGEADRRNVEAFQRAQGWRGSEADGYPGRETWRRLFAPTP
ncbi:peptidoglycan-binding protein [Streptomyces sp. NPDC005963]|uniref:peptidoglycan-binding protein n=1 Tax=Streptomyces sp. NPDC005963 TaxID=3156721 RepID=UPI0033EF6A9F